MTDDLQGGRAGPENSRAPGCDTGGDSAAITTPARHETDSMMPHSAEHAQDGDSPMLRAALEARRQGFDVVQLHGLRADGKTCTCRKGPECRSAAKHPVLDSWTAAEPMTEDEIRKAWSGWRRDHNFGIRTGSRSSTWVLDVDPEHGGDRSLARLEAELGPLPSTRQVKTGSGGSHFYFKLPVDFDVTNARRALKDYAGLDIRGTGGQVVAPPSVTDKGAYERVDDSPIAEAPPRLLDMLRPKERTTPEPAAMPKRQNGDPRLTTYAERAWGGEVARLTKMAQAAVPAGQTYVGEPWDITTFEVACNLLELANAEWTPYDVHDALVAVTQHAPTDSGFTPDDVQKKIDSAVKKVGDTARPAPAERNDDIFGWDIFDNVATTTSSSGDSFADWESTSGAGESATSSWDPVDLTPFLDGTHKPLEATVLTRSDGHSLFYRGRTHSTHGESESGKSMVVQVTAADLLKQGESVAYLDYESTADVVVGRLLLMGVPAAAVKERFTYIRPEVSPLHTPTAWQRLLDSRFALLVIDGVTESLATMGRGSNDNDEVTSWFRLVPRRLAQATTAAVVMVDHVTKSTDGRGRFAIGAQAKLAALDGAAYSVEVVEPLGRGMRGSVRLWVGKDREGGVRPYCGHFRATDRSQLAATVVVDSTAGPITWEVQAPEEVIGTERKPFRPTHLMERISRALEGSSGPLSSNALVKSADLVAGQAAAKQAALRLLVEEDYVKTEKGTRNTLLHTSHRPYREALDGWEPVAAEKGSSAPPDRTGTGSPLGRVNREPVTDPSFTGSENQSRTSRNRWNQSSSAAPCEACGQPSIRYTADGSRTCGSHEQAAS